MNHIDVSHCIDLKKIDYSYQALVIQKVLDSKPENIIILFLFYIL